MALNPKRSAALNLLARTGIWRSSYAPPFVRLLWWLGVDAPPPHLASFRSNALHSGIYFSVFYGLSMWLMVWSREGMSFTGAVGFAVCTGVFYGLSMAAYYDYSRRKHGLPLWDQWQPPAK